MTKPVAVIIGDVHFTVATLELATSSVKRAMWEAIRLNVPLIINGDTLDSKAIVRGECANRLIELLEDYNVKVIINVGNHDLISEKGSEHVLHFLKPYCDVVQSPVFLESVQSYIIPYQTSAEALQCLLKGLPGGSRLIVHQGVQTAFLGHYTQDKTSLPPEAFADFRVIASHYHRRQDIRCGELGDGGVGLFSYIGNPYSLTFGEADDGPKGFSILNDDGSLKFVPTNLRSHKKLPLFVIAGGGLSFDKTLLPASNDLLWVKATGSRSDLDKLDKVQVGDLLIGHSNYKLEKIPVEDFSKVVHTPSVSDSDLFDSIIDSLAEEPSYKEKLKKAWKDLL